MRCFCCNKLLTDYESTIKSESTGEYLDTCTTCLSTIPEVGIIDRPDLKEYEDVNTDEEDNYEWESI